jgi:hypothetical protein
MYPNYSGLCGGAFILADKKALTSFLLIGQREEDCLAVAWVGVSSEGVDFWVYTFFTSFLLVEWGDYLTWGGGLSGSSGGGGEVRSEQVDFLAL